MLVYSFFSAVQIAAKYPGTIFTKLHPIDESIMDDCTFFYDYDAMKFKFYEEELENPFDGDVYDLSQYDFYSKYVEVIFNKDLNKFEIVNNTEHFKEFLGQPKNYFDEESKKFILV